MQTLELIREGARVSVWLNRPQVRNAFNEILISELTDTFAQLSDDPSVRVIVLSGRGTTFCAGADLQWMQKMAGYSYEENYADALKLASLLRTVYECKKPVLARVHGPCFAGGMGLIAACDIVFASTEAEFCLSEVKLGLIPATISPYVIKAMGEQAARRYFLTAERFTAAQAHHIGLIHLLCESTALDDSINSMVKTLQENAPSALHLSKQLIRDISGQLVNDSLLKETAKRIATVRASPEAKEGIQSFLEKRKPAWSLNEPQESK